MKVGHLDPGVPLPAVGAGVAGESQEMIVGVLAHRVGTRGPQALNYLRPKPMAVSDCFYTDSWKMGNLQRWAH